MNISIIRSEEISILKDFLKGIPSIKDVNDNIIKNSVVIWNDSNIIGNISIELYDKVGLIRYFVFRKSIKDSFLHEMINILVLKAKELNINKLICIADNIDVENLFLGLNFIKTENKVFFDEDIYTNIGFKDSSFLVFSI